MAQDNPAPTYKVLLVEDEWLIADHLQMLVESCGFAVIGPVPTVSAALGLLESSQPDAALLDVTLGDERSYPVATALCARGVPFVLLTGYAPADLPSNLGQSALLNKPFHEDEVCATLRRVLDDAHT